MQRERGTSLRGPLRLRVLLHPSWLPAGALLVAHLTATVFGGYSIVLAVLLSIVAFAGVLGSLVWHELVHRAAARIQHTRRIPSALYPFGDATPSMQAPSPSSAAFVALAGPAASGVLCALLYAAVSKTSGAATALLWTLAAANATVTILNLLPAYPFDGGCVAQAFVAWRTKQPHHATRTAARAGEVIGALMIAGGAAGFAREFPSLRGAAGLWAVAVGAVVVRTARGARRAASVARVLDGHVGDWATPFAGRVRIDDVVPAGTGLYAVADAGRLAGIAPASAAGKVARDAMLRWSPALACRAADPIDTAIGRMASSGMDVIVVLDDGGIARGVLTSAAVGERIRGAL